MKRRRSHPRQRWLFPQLKPKPPPKPKRDSDAPKRKRKSDITRWFESMKG